MKALGWLVVPVLFAVSGMVYAYDAEMAAKIHANATSKLDQQALSTGACKITSDKLLDMMRKKEPLVLLDVRTPAERNVIKLGEPGAVQVSLDQLFVADNLDMLPTDKPIVVICHTGARAAAAAILLRSIGFENARFLKGGMVELVTQLTPKTAPAP